MLCLRRFFAGELLNFMELISLYNIYMIYVTYICIQIEWCLLIIGKYDIFVCGYDFVAWSRVLSSSMNHSIL